MKGEIHLDMGRPACRRVEHQGCHARAVIVHGLLHLPGAHPDHADGAFVAGGQQVGGGAVGGDAGDRALVVSQGAMLYPFVQVEYLTLLVATSNSIRF